MDYLSVFIIRQQIYSSANKSVWNESNCRHEFFPEIFFSFSLSQVIYSFIRSTVKTLFLISAINEQQFSPLKKRVYNISMKIKFSWKVLHIFRELGLFFWQWSRFTILWSVWKRFGRSFDKKLAQTILKENEEGERK